MTTKAQLITENAQLAETIEIFGERLAELELALEDENWIRTSLDGQTEFSREGLRKILMLARLAYLKNPLIKRAVNVQAYYVWGQGVGIEATPAEVDPVVQSFLDHPKNQAELTSHQARTLKEIGLQLTSNLFLVLFTNASTGRVIVRSIPVDDILSGDIITNPEDRREPWFYKRVWVQRSTDLDTGQPTTAERTAYYPDFRYRPPVAARRARIGDHPVLWDQPVMHVKTGGLDDMKFGVPEVYAALDWATAVRKDLERYATLRAALARWAHKLTTEGGPTGVAAAKAKLGTTLGAGGTGAPETNPPPVVGSTFVSTPTVKLEAMQTRGALPDPDEGRRLGLMVSAATGIPETMLFGDAEVGNLATAKTLDRPTELMMLDRQTLWADVFKDILAYVVEQAARRANGPLDGAVAVEDDPEDAAIVRLVAPDEEGRPTPVGFDVTFPAILERDVVARVDAILKAATLSGAGGSPANTLDPRTTIALLLDALAVDDIDELLDELAPEGTTWEDLRLEPTELEKAAAAAKAAPPAGEDDPDAAVREALHEVRAALAKLAEAA